MKYLFLPLILMLMSPLAWAFPENVRHGYGNCTSCHVSPTGGGVLTDYGRELSREVLSTWGKEKETRWMYFVNQPEWLKLGGDFRAVQTYINTPTVESGRFIPMQADLEAAVIYKDFTFVQSFGKQDGDDIGQDDWISRRHYIIYRPLEQLSFRGGRFMPAYGINVPDHIIVTRQDLRWNISNETYNLESAWIGDQVNLYLTGVFGRPGSNNARYEKGVAFSGTGFAFDRYKAGASYFYGDNDTTKRHVFGPHAILGFTPHFFLLTELDFQSQSVKATPHAPAQFGLANYQRLDYEIIQGLHVYLTQEARRLDFKQASTLMTRYGIGTQFFPRPHIEINTQFMQQKMAPFNSFSDFFWIMLHFYP